MVDILLIQPPIEDFYFTHKRSIPYGLMSIAAVLKDRGFSVALLDCLAVNKSKKIPVPDELDYLSFFYGNSDGSAFSLFHDYRHYGYSFEYVGKKTRDLSPFLVGISSLFTPYSDMAEQVAQSVKKFWPECHVVMGGHHPTVLPESVMACSAVDFLIRGEGEIAMPLLADCLRKTNRESALGDLESIPGIVFRKAEGLHISEPTWIEDLQTLPLPDFSLMNHSYYSRKGRGSAVVVAGRGCPMPCTYCSVGASSHHGKFRQRSISHIMDELTLQMERYNVGFIDFEDENLTLNRKWFMALMERIIALREMFQGKKLEDLKTIPDEIEKKAMRFDNKNGLELRAMNGLYPPSLDLEMVKAMKSAGFKTLNLSLGSTSAAQLKAFRRPDVRAAYEAALTMAQACGLDTVSYIIAGAPGQSPWDSLNDLIYLTAQKTLVGLSIYYPAPGSVDYGRCKEKGILSASFSQMRSSALPLDDTTSRLESVTLLRLARIINFLKAILDENGTLPEAEPFFQSPWERLTVSIQSGVVREDDHGVLEKKEMNRQLLKWFLYDGKIRGVNKAGQLFEHHVSTELTGHFLTRLEQIDIQGSR